MTARCPWWAPPLLAVQFLTRLPVPATGGLSPESVRRGLRRSGGWFPLVGTLVGMVTAAVALAAHMLWPVYVAVPLALVVEARLTGAFHEDAVADFCDGFGGGTTPDDVLRILKDSRIGSYGALGLVLAVALRGGLLGAVLTAMEPLAAAIASVASAAFGRLLAVVVMAIVAPAPVPGGLARDIGARIGTGTLLLAALLALPAMLPFAAAHPAAAIATVAGAAAFVLWFRGLLRGKLGGSTGDCLGFAAYAGQVLLLLAAAARLS